MQAFSLDFVNDDYVDFFCNKYKEISHKELKNLHEFNQIKDQTIKEKIYFKTRYNFLKSNCSAIDNVSYIKKSNFKNSQNSKFSISFTFILKTLICLSIFSFLANESIYFYKQMGLPVFFCFLLPIVLELTVIFLSAHKDFLSKFFLFFIVLFNISSFSLNTIDRDRINLEAKKIRTETLLEINRVKLEREEKIKNLNIELSNYRKLYTDLISKGYFSKADQTLRPEILRMENILEQTNISLPSLNPHKTSPSNIEYDVMKNISLNSVNLIILKTVLLFVFLLFIKDLKELTNKDLL